MKTFHGREGHLVRLERGEEIHTALTRFAEENAVKGAVVQGLGAIRDAELGYYNMERRAYERRTVPDPTELLGLTGNLSMRHGKPFLHAHVVLMRRDLTVVGGHLFRGTITATGEFSVRQVDLDLVRLPDAEVGLDLLEAGPEGDG